MATLRDVARLAGYDPSTVSRVLHDARGASTRPETRDRILAAARQLDYRPNVVARSLRTKRTGAIAFLVPDLDNPAIGEITRGVQAAADAAGYMVLIGEVNALSADLHERLVREGRVDGIVAAYAQLDDRTLPADFGAPLVVLNRQVDGASGQVIVDDEAAGRLAVDHLVERGHRRIGHLSGPLRTDTGVRRKRGFLAGLQARGLPLDERWLVEGDYTEAGGYRAASVIVGLPPDARPTALSVGNLAMALGAVRALREAGLRIPDEVSLITLDEHSIARHTDPPLTTVKMPLREMGETGARMLIGAIGGEAPSRIMVTDPPPILVIRGSVGPGPAGAPDD